jgi:hypothetical protein
VKAAVRVVVGLALAQALVVALFVLPAHDPQPHDLPVAIVAPPGAALALLQSRRGALDVQRVTDLREGRQAILDRDVYGALDIQQRRLLVSSAASPQVALLLEGAFRPRQTIDVRRLDPDDPRGATLNLAMLPLLVFAFPFAGIIRRFKLSAAQDLALAVGFSILGALLVRLVVGTFIGAIPGPFLALWAVGALLIASVTLPTMGLTRLIGPIGIAVVAVIVILIGNPGSGNASAPELLPGFWRVVGPNLPPGAGGTAIRNVAYFDGAALAHPLVVLLVFTLIGLTFFLASHRRAHYVRPS